MVVAIILLVWLIGAVVTYLIFKKKDMSLFERIWYSLFWVVLPPLYLIHWIHMKF